MDTTWKTIDKNECRSSPKGWDHDTNLPSGNVNPEGVKYPNGWLIWCVTPSGFDVYRNSFYNHYTPSGLMDTTWKTIEKNECRSSPKGEISEWLIDLLSHPSGVWCLSKFFLQPLHPFGVNGYNTKTIDKNERRSSLKGCDHDNESTIRQC